MCDVITLVVSKSSQTRKKPWFAKITGTHFRYGLAREFLVYEAIQPPGAVEANDGFYSSQAGSGQADSGHSCWTPEGAADAVPGTLCAGNTAVTYFAAHISQAGIYETCSVGDGHSVHHFWAVLHVEDGSLCSIPVALRDVQRLLGQVAYGKRLEDLMPEPVEPCWDDSEAHDPSVPRWRLPESLTDARVWPLPEPELPAASCTELPPAPAVSGGRYPAAVAEAIDRLLEIRSRQGADQQAVQLIDRALHALTQSPQD